MRSATGSGANPAGVVDERERLIAVMQSTSNRAGPARRSGRRDHVVISIARAFQRRRVPPSSVHQEPRRLSQARE